jgi:hypothetical protein
MKKSQENILKMYKHLGLLAGQAISPQSFGNLQYKFLSPPERRDKEQIINSLVDDGYIDENGALTEKGESALYE